MEFLFKNILLIAILWTYVSQNKVRACFMSLLMLQLFAQCEKQIYHALEAVERESMNMSSIPSHVMGVLHKLVGQ